MNAPSQKIGLGRALARLELFSPAGFVVRALLLAIVFAVCELAGLREYATFLSGTQHGGQWSSSVLGGVAYLFAYYGFVLGAPILLIAAGLLAGWRRLVRVTSSRADSPARATAS